MLKAMNIVIFIFVVSWVLVALYGINKPRDLLRSFVGLSRVLGIEPDVISDKSLILFKIILGFFLMFGLFILFQMLNGNVNF